MKLRHLYFAISISVFMLLLVSCGGGTVSNWESAQGENNEVESIVQQATPTIDLSSVQQTKFVIDGLDDDWQTASGGKVDEADDQSAGTPDFAGAAAQNNLTHFYVSASFHTQAPIMYYVLLVDVTEVDWDYQIMLDPVTYQATISPFGYTLSFEEAPEIAFVLKDVLEVRIPLSLFDGHQVTNLTIATSTGGPWFGDQVEDIHPETVQEADLLALESDDAGVVNILDERPGNAWLFDQQAYANYLFRSFIQNPIKLTWGPDGYMYIADWLGKHIVKVGKDGSQEDLGFWKTVPDIQNDGPLGVSFDNHGVMFFFTHRNIFRVEEDLSVNRLEGISGSQIGDVIFDSENNLYYTDLDGGALFSWTEGGGSTAVLTGLDSPQYMAFGLDGTLYVTLQNKDKVMQIDLSAGSAEEFVSEVVGRDPNFITVDADGDIWIRALRGLLQFSPEGTLIPFTVDGEVHEGGPNRDNWITSAGIAFDDEGALWVASYNSLVLRLVPDDLAVDSNSFSRTVISTGFQAYDLSMGQDGSVYASDNNSHAILKFTPGEEPIEIFQHNLINNSALVVTYDNEIFIGLADQRIVRLEDDGSFTTIANFLPQSMIAGTDGALYAVKWEQGQDVEIIRITGPLETEVWVTEIGGIPLGDGVVRLALTADGGGLLVFKESGRDLYQLGYDGEGSLIMNLASLGFVGEMGGGVAFGASPITGLIYFIPHGPYTFYEIDPVGEIREIGRGMVGDPSSMVFSPDGGWLYIEESGAIQMIPLDTD